MSASTFHEPVQLYDEQVARLAPFPVLLDPPPRQRSSSLAHVVPSRPLKGDSPLVHPAASPQPYSVWDDEAMPGILSRVLSRRTSLEAGAIHKDTGGKLKVTEKGRERRLSAGNWRHRSASSAASGDSGRGASIDNERSPSASESSSNKAVDTAVRHSSSSTSNQRLTPTTTPLAQRRASPMQLDDVTNLSRVPSSGAEEEDSSPSLSDTSITQQRAHAYAALTGRSNGNLISCSTTELGTQPSPSHTEVVMAQASLSTPSLAYYQPRYQPLRPRDPNALPDPTQSPSPAAQSRRRTTSSNDAPMNNETLHKTSMPAHKTARRSRVQSAGALPPTVSSYTPRQTPTSRQGAISPHQPTITPTSTPGGRKNRRSLSQENSLVATRIARAFLIRELGENAIVRNKASASATSNMTPSKNWTNSENEQKELWLALHDGVLICRLLNQIVPNSIAQIDKRDLNSAKKANIAAFIHAARQHLPLQPHEFFDVDNLYSGSPSGFERVLHTLCSIAEYVALKQHGLFQTSILDASKSVESLLPLPREPMLCIRAPSPSPPLSAPAASNNNGDDVAMNVEGGSLLSPVQNRLNSPVSLQVGRSPTLTSANGNKIRSRTTSRTTPAGSVLSPRVEVASAGASPSSGVAIRSLEEQTPRETSTASQLSNHPRTYHHGVYGNNPDRRMCESAVEIMSVVKEGDETPQQSRRSASDRPQERKGGVLNSSPECTPTKKAAEKGYPGIALITHSSAFSDSDAASSASERMAMLDSGLPIPNARAIRLRQSIVSSPNTGGHDLLKGNSPRLVRKRHSADRPIPVRSNSTSPIPSSSSGLANVPFPQAPPLLVRARTSVGPAGEDINEDTEGSSIEDGDIPENRKERTTSADPNEELPLRPRQHKRWNSEVHETPVPISRLQEAVPSRARHNSFMPTSGQATNHDDRQPSPRHSGELRRRAPDRRQSMDASRQRLVVREPGKVPITYQLGECIGRGQFGSVYRALNIHTGSVVAVKRIRLAGKTEEEANQLQKEVDLLKRLSHPSVVKYEGLVRTEHYLNIVMEYVENGSLHNTLAAFGILPEALVASYVVKILEGLSYLHRMQVIHRDLKAANILTTKKGNIKLSDFGVSLQLSAVQSTIENADATGTPNWMAPEVIKLEKATYASDIWSLACTVVELLTGKPPYANMLAMTAMFKIVEDDMPPLPKGCSPDLQDFLSLCFAKDPRQRPSAEALFEHVWLRKHWSNHKQTLRAQDSIPFLRRISSEYRRPQFDQQDSPPSDTLPDLDRSVSSPCQSSLLNEDVNDTDSIQDNVTVVDALECRSQAPNGSISNLPIPDLDVITSEMLRQGKDINTPLVPASASDAYPFPQFVPMQTHPFQLPISPRPGPNHSFVKTTFSKPIECRLCHKPVKKYAVLCEDCGLICHASCKEFAPMPCDLRSQLLGLSIPPSFAAQQATTQALGVSVPTVEPSPLTSPSQFAFHSKFGIGKGRRPKPSPSSEEAPSSAEGSPSPQSPDSPRRSNKGIALIRSRTQSPDGVGYVYARQRPASYASSGSFPRSHEMHQGSMSSSSDSHPLSSSSIPEEGLAVSPLPVLSPSPLHNERRIVSAPNPSLKPPPAPKHTRNKSAKRQSGTDCIIS